MAQPTDVVICAATIYGEARGTTQADREDVMGVIWNRWKHGPRWMKRGSAEYPAGTLAGVCTSPWQFSCWNHSDPNWIKLLAIKHDPMKALGQEDFRPCFEAALKVIREEGSHLPEDVLHYHAKWMDFPASWGDPIEPFYDNGHHVFYRGLK